MIEIRWHGRGGQGAFTASKILGAAACLDGKYALAFPSFGPERRGAPIQAFTKIDEQNISDRSVIRYCDYIVYLDETLYTPASLEDLKSGGKVLINSAKREKYQDKRIITVDADRIAEELIGRPVSNTTMLAALIKEADIVSAGNAEKSLEFYFSGRVAEKNKVVIRTITQQE